MLEHETQRQHAAERVAEQVAGLDALRIEERQQIRAELRKAERLFATGLREVSMAAQVRRQQPAEIRELREPRAEIVPVAGQTVEQHEGAPLPLDLTAGKLDITEGNTSGLHLTPMGLPAADA